MPKIWSGPQQCDWEVYAGDSNSELFEVTANDPMDITGAIIEAQARKTATDTEIALTATVQITEPLLGQFAVSWDGEEIRTLLAGESSWQGVWDLQITQSGASLPDTLLRGTFIATHDVTRGLGTP